MKARWWLIAAWALIGVAPVAGAQAPASAQAVPVEDFFRLPQISEAKLSPSGKQLALLAGAGGRIGLFVTDLAKPDRIRVAAGFRDIDIGEFHWVNDQRLVFDVVDYQLGGGDQRFYGGLFSVTPQGTELRTLIRPGINIVVGAGGSGLREPLDGDHALLKVLHDGGNEVIVGRFARDRRYDLREVVPLRLNVVNGTVTSMAHGMPGNTRQWLFDPKGEPRVAVSVSEGKQRVLWREPGKDQWEPLAQFNSLQEEWIPLFLDARNTLYVSRTDSSGFRVLTRFDWTTRKPSNEPFVSTPGFDFSGHFEVNSQRTRVLGVHLTTDAATTVWLDDKMKRLQALADERFPGRVNRLSCERCDGTDPVVLVHSWSDREPGEYHVYDAATKRWTMVGRSQPQIDSRRMAEVSFERIRARDGLDLPLWITRPAGTKPTTPLPAVVMVHGGPWVRGGQWAWEPTEQFLASRGYLVINPEYRGSTGYGQAHFRAGWRQYGRAMQDDVADALQWAIKQGWVDPKRVCIAGASYGGYAALMGLVRHPELYRCGIAWVAVTDVRLLFEDSWASDISEEARRWSLPTLIGDPIADAAMLREVSPVTHAARIKAPLLLAFGQEDRRVPLEHGQAMRSALQDVGRNPEWVVYPGEGHGWLRIDNRVNFAKRLEAFLARHLSQ